MKKIYENDEMLIFSDKEFKERNGMYLEFFDGSRVDLYDYSITNIGVGEIEISYMPIKPIQENLITRRKNIGSIDSISLLGGAINVKIISSQNDKNSIDITGTQEFLNKFYLRESMGYLEIQAPDDGKNIVTGEIWINGKRQRPDPNPLYGEITISISQLNNLQLLSKAKGNVFCALPINYLHSEINGSLTLNLSEVGQANVKISGSGDVVINSICKKSQFNISGSGSVNIKNGNVDEITLGVSGSGSISAMISANKAYLDLSGSGNIVIDRIKEVSYEKKSGSGSIKVLRRGY